MIFIRKFDKTGSVVDNIKGVTGSKRKIELGVTVQCAEKTVQGSDFFASLYSLENTHKTPTDDLKNMFTRHKFFRYFNVYDKACRIDFSCIC
jgi:urate oxidase